MGRMKDLLIGQIEKLCRATGYDFEFLMDMWFTYTDECLEDGGKISWDYFRTVTLERDW